MDLKQASRDDLWKRPLDRLAHRALRRSRHPREEPALATLSRRYVLIQQQHPTQHPLRLSMQRDNRLKGRFDSRRKEPYHFCRCSRHESGRGRDPCHHGRSRTNQDATTGSRSEGEVVQPCPSITPITSSFPIRTGRDAPQPAPVDTLTAAQGATSSDPQRSQQPKQFSTGGNGTLKWASVQAGETFSDASSASTTAKIPQGKNIITVGGMSLAQAKAAQEAQEREQALAQWKPDNSQSTLQRQNRF